jgi:hypothetical protein
VACFDCAGWKVTDVQYPLEKSGFPENPSATGYMYFSIPFRVAQSCAHGVQMQAGEQVRVQG